MFYVLCEDSSLVIYKNPTDLNEKVIFYFDNSLEPQNFFVDSSYCVVFSKEKDLSIYSLTNYLPKKIVLNEKLSEHDDLIGFIDKKLLFNSNDGVKIFSFESNKLNLIEHLEELRKRIIYSISGIAIFSTVGFFFSKKILNLIIKQSNIQTAYFFSPAEAFSAQIKVAIFVGILISFPLILYQTWAFISPGLTKKELNLSLSYLFSGLVLFIIGIIFGYFILIPLGLKFFFSFGSESLQPLINISKYLNFIIWCLLGCGFLFQLPLLLFFLIKLDIIDIKTVTGHRAEAIVAILILCAIITPTGDFFTLLLISLPLLLLFELSILVARISKRTTKKD